MLESRGFTATQADGRFFAADSDVESDITSVQIDLLDPKVHIRSVRYLSCSFFDSCCFSFRFLTLRDVGTRSFSGEPVSSCLHGEMRREINAGSAFLG